MEKLVAMEGYEDFADMSVQLSAQKSSHLKKRTQSANHHHHSSVNPLHSILEFSSQVFLRTHNYSKKYRLACETSRYIHKSST